MKVTNRLLLCVGLMIASLPLQAQPAATTPSSQPVPSGPDVVRMTLRPMRTTQPVLEYRLLPDVPDQTPGNAATLYLIAARHFPDAKTTEELRDKAIDYNCDYPVDQLPQKEAEQLLGRFAESLRYVELAARRKDVQWDSAWREDGYYASMPYLNDMKLFANLLALRARLQLARRDRASAEQTMQTGLAMARQLGSEPPLGHGLVAGGVAQATLNRGVEAWIALGDSPNLYWALSSLPSPFLDLHAIARVERAQLHFTSPDLGLALKDRLPPERWPLVIRQIVRLGHVSQYGFEPAQPLDVEASARQLTESTYPRARQRLLSSGVAKEKVEAMPADQVVGTFLLQQYRTFSDESWKGFELPFAQVSGLIRQQEEQLAQAEREYAGNPLIQAPSPARSLLRIRCAFARTDRQIAVLRTIEAIRDYAARHDGRPPQRLEQITDLPLPVDPFTGTPFAYRVEGPTAIIDAADPHLPARGWRYELTFIK